MKKRVLGIILALLMIAALLPMAALADPADPVAKIGPTGYATLADAFAAAKSGETIEIVAASSAENGMYELPSPISNLTIKSTVPDKEDGSCAVVFNGIKSYGQSTGKLTGVKFENIKIVFGNAAYKGFQHSSDVEFNDCEFDGLFYSYGSMVFNNCSFVQTTKEYIMWLYAGDVVFNNCTMTANGKFFNVYNEGNTAVPWKVTTNNCTYINTGDANKAVFNVKETCGAKVLKYAVEIEGTNTIVGAFPAASDNGTLTVLNGLVQVDDRLAQPTENGSEITVAAAEGAKLASFDDQAAFDKAVEDKGSPEAAIAAAAVDMEVSYETPETTKVAKIGDAKYTSLADAMNAAKKGDTVELLCDIDLAGENWTPIADFKATLDGKGFTIKNMTVNDTAHAYAGFVCMLSGTIKNVTFDNASVTGLRVGVVAGSNGEWTDAVIENVNVTNSKMFGEQKCGGIMGFVRGVDNTGVGSLTVKNCTVENFVADEIAAGDTIAQVGGLLGYVDYGVNLTVEGCSVKDIVIKNDFYSSEYGQSYNNPLYASNEFIGVVNNKITGTVKGYDQFTIALKGNSVSGELNEIRREACNKECSLIGGYYNFLDEYSKNPTKIVVDEAELTDELAINKEAAIAELDELAQNYTTDEAKAVIEQAKLDVAAAETVEAVKDIVALAKEDATAAEELALAKAEAVAELDALALNYTTNEAKAVIEAAKAAVAEAETVEAVEEIMANVETEATAAEAAAIAAAELAEAKEAAVATFESYVAKLKLNDNSFMQAEIDKINAAADKAAVAEALAAARARADGQKQAEIEAAAQALADAKTAAIAQLEAVVGDNDKQSVKDMLASYIEQINNAKTINEVNSIVPGATSALKQQLEIAAEGTLVSAIRNFVNAVDRNNQVTTSKVMGIIKPILGIFGIR